MLTGNVSFISLKDSAWEVLDSHFTYKKVELRKVQSGIQGRVGPTSRSALIPKVHSFPLEHAASLLSLLPQELNNQGGYSIYAPRRAPLTVKGGGTLSNYIRTTGRTWHRPGRTGMYYTVVYSTYTVPYTKGVLVFIFAWSFEAFQCISPLSVMPYS